MQEKNWKSKLWYFNFCASLVIEIKVYTSCKSKLTFLGQFETARVPSQFKWSLFLMQPTGNKCVTPPPQWPWLTHIQWERLWVLLRTKHPVQRTSLTLGHWEHLPTFPWRQAFVMRSSNDNSLRVQSKHDPNNGADLSRESGHSIPAFLPSQKEDNLHLLWKVKPGPIFNRLGL